jgi:chemotaxis protein CheX
MSLSNPELAKPFIVATRHVLVTMAQMDPKPGTPYVKKNRSANGDVSALVGFTGDASGSISLSFPRACAIAIVKGMLGPDVGDIIADAKDAVGEVSNMISGQARAGLSDLGIKLQGSTPTIIFGDNHYVSHVSNAPVVAIPFTTDFGEFTLEFCFS